jgi:outer membrane protein OmpA-like peptidoglycan-associated protein
MPRNSVIVPVVTSDAAAPATATADATDAGAVEDAAADAEPPPPRGIAIYGADTIQITQFVSFAPNSDDIGKEHVALLDAVAEAMTKNDLRVVIEGNADKSEGAAAKRLSETRGRKVAEALVSRGVPKDRLRTRAYGTTKPLEPKSSAKNRYVRFAVVQPDETFEDAGAPVK